MPRKEILRAVESTGKLGLVEKSFLWVFSWLDTRFRVQDYWAMSRDSYHSMHRQMPLTHAEKYKLRIIWYWYPLYCLGGISFLAFIILVITGTILGICYVPGGEGDPTPAYSSMEFIMTQLPFGYIIRSIHHWTTHFMVAAVFLHMCRVYFTGAYRNPRELNWLIGVGLMFFTIFFGYSGYLLPWDSLAFGAATLGINMANSTPLIGGWIATDGGLAGGRHPKTALGSWEWHHPHTGRQCCGHVSLLFNEIVSTASTEAVALAEAAQ